MDSLIPEQVPEPISYDAIKAEGKTILHITDLHYAVDAHRNQHVWALEGESGRGPTMAEAITRAVEREKIGAVVVTGDLTFLGSDDEYAQAGKGLVRLLGTLGLGVESLVVVPGNHDIVWTQGATYDKNAEVAQAPPAATENYRRFYQNLFRHEPNIHLSMGRRYLFPSGVVVEIAALNSSSLETGKSFLAGMGRVQALSNCGMSIEQLSKRTLTPRLDLSSLPLVVATCAEILPDVRLLSSGVEMIGVMPSLNATIKVAIDAYKGGVDGARQLLFDACDQFVHCASFVLPVTALESVTCEHLNTMALLALSGDKRDQTLFQRYSVRHGDVLKICGHDVDALATTCRALESADERRQLHTLSYPAFRTSSIQAAKADLGRTEFEKIITYAKKGIDSGRLNPHEISHVYNGLSETFAHRFQKTKNSSHRREALAYRELAMRRSALAEEHAGGRHLEFLLRDKRLPLTFAQTGILDLVSVDGMSPRARQLQIATELKDLAKTSGNDRIVQQMTGTIKTLRK